MRSDSGRKRQKSYLSGFPYARESATYRVSRGETATTPQGKDSTPNRILCKQKIASHSSLPEDLFPLNLFGLPQLQFLKPLDCCAWRHVQTEGALVNGRIEFQPVERKFHLQACQWKRNPYLAGKAYPTGPLVAPKTDCHPLISLFVHQMHVLQCTVSYVNKGSPSPSGKIVLYSANASPYLAGSTLQ